MVLTPWPNRREKIYFAVSLLTLYMFFFVSIFTVYYRKTPVIAIIQVALFTFFLNWHTGVVSRETRTIHANHTLWYFVSFLALFETLLALYSIGIAVMSIHA